MEIRLNKYLSEAGVCSRREADRLIESGKVTVDGKRAEMGMKVTESKRRLTTSLCRKLALIAISVNVLRIVVHI